MNTSLSVCVYCGSRTPESSALKNIAVTLGERLVSQHWKLVYGGGKVGMMGIIADTVLEHNGEVIGVIPTSLMKAEVAHTGIQQLIETPNMHSRKAKMEALSDAFVVLPGGFGTLDEFFEILTWRQLGFHNKPIFLVNMDGYFDGLLQFCASAFDHNFLRPESLELFETVENADQIIERIREYYA
ncbi:MAG: TIGR00730 family Rossman fold protein [Bacteroidota bacterium]